MHLCNNLNNINGEKKSRTSNRDHENLFGRTISPEPEPSREQPRFDAAAGREGAQKYSRSS